MSANIITRQTEIASAFKESSRFIHNSGRSCFVELVDIILGFSLFYFRNKIT